MEADNKKKEIKTIDDSASKPQRPVVETYAGDMADVMGGNTEGLVKKIIHGEENKEAEKKKLSPESKRNKIFLIISVLLLVLALSVSAFFFFKRITGTVAVQQPSTPLIFTDQATSLEVAGMKKDEIAQAVSNEVAKTTIQSGEVEGIYLTENKQNIGMRRFLTLIGAHLVPDNNTLFVSDNFLLGVVKNGANADTTSGTGFFILLKVRSATDIFESLRVWEPNILNDLHGFFGINLASETEPLFTTSFQDGVIENKNARILYDQNGNLVLTYIFADDNSVIITDSLNTAHEVMLRLASVQPQQ